ncbi:MAG: extracellular solute-binding protein [Acidimicrobiaceae bacterium]|nr:extracellular solute-binding protein [Acidimicrobiaceae bacterium]MYF43443.1 extracellular solute-binding protein [Acidimicrobiaceae bacterium]
MSKSSTILRLFGVFLALSLIAGACGDDAAEPADDAAQPAADDAAAPAADDEGSEPAADDAAAEPMDDEGAEPAAADAAEPADDEGAEPAADDAAAPAEEFDLEVLVFETPALTPEFWDATLAAAAAPIEGVNVVKLVTPDLDRTAYAKQLQASGQFPDVQAALNVNDFVEADLLVPYRDDYLNEHYLFPDATKIDGNAWQTPSGGQIITMVFYNENVFADLGLDVPTTYAEFLDVAQATRDAGFVPISYAGAEPWSASLTLSTIMAVDVLGHDPDWVIKRTAGEVSFSDANVVAAANKWKQFVDEGLVDDGALGVAYDGATNAFLDGEAAMYMMGSWWLGAAGQADFPVGVFPFPSDSGDVVVPLHVGGNLSVSALAEDVDRAMQFAQNWHTDPEVSRFLIESDGLFVYVKGQGAPDLGADVLPIYNEAFAWTTDTSNSVVPPFAWTVNDRMLMPPGFNDEFYAAAQNIFLGDDVVDEMARLDEAFDAAIS